MKKLPWKRIAFTAPGKAECVMLETEEPESLFRDELWLKTEYTLVSPGTELDCLRGEAGGTRFPKYLGYSAVARVLKCGAEATEFQEGDRVLVYHSTHSSYLVKDKHDVVKVPSGLAPEEAVFAVVGCMGLQGVRKVRPELGEAGLVAGLGLLGQIASQCAALSGAFPLIVLDFNPFRRELALKNGATFAFSPDEENLTEKIKELTYQKQGINAAVEVTGNPQTVKQVLKLCAPQARVALVGCSRTPTPEIDFYNDVHRPGIQLIGGHNFVRPQHDSYPGYWTMRKDMETLMNLILAGKVNTRSLLTQIALPEEASSIYPRFLNREEKLLGVVFDWTK